MDSRWGRPPVYCFDEGGIWNTVISKRIFEKKKKKENSGSEIE